MVYYSIMNEIDQHKENLAMTLFGRSRTLALAGNQCVKCGATQLEFRDAISEKEYKISALCQNCQDLFFEEPSPSGEVL